VATKAGTLVPRRPEAEAVGDAPSNGQFLQAIFFRPVPARRNSNFRPSAAKMPQGVQHLVVRLFAESACRRRRCVAFRPRRRRGRCRGAHRHDVANHRWEFGQLHADSAHRLKGPFGIAHHKVGSFQGGAIAGSQWAAWPVSESTVGSRRTLTIPSQYAEAARSAWA